MELDALLAPVAASAPCGDDLSFSVEFDRIAEMRRADDATLDQGEWVTALKVSDWPGVAAACGELLAGRTKDLRLAMWMTEAWAMLDGFQGLARGLRLCALLSERYWHDLHPRVTEGDTEERAGNIAWLLQRVTALAAILPVARGRHDAAFSLRDLAAARQLQPALERQPDEVARLAEGRVTLEQFNRALRETPARTLLATLAAARRCGEQLLGWQAVVDAHLGADGPGFVQARETLAEVAYDIERLARDCGALAAPLAGPTMPPDAGGQAGESSHGAADARAPSGIASALPAAGGPPRTRAQALQQLRDVAAFFRQAEPHSPVAYLAEKAVKWGEMPLHEWLRQVVKDHGAMAHLHELLGLAEGEPGAG